MTDDERTVPLGEEPEESPSSVAPVVPGYNLLHRIGEGGMGEVWLAEQVGALERKVALKVIRRGMDTDRFVARFEAERRALARMDHPCIARVYDAGATEQGRPYFAMEALDGERIDAYCDRKRLGTRDRIRLFLQVCEGVQHAHQKAILHRDLKPSNVLVTEVDGRPLPKIIDFGLAKAIGDPFEEGTLLTEVGQFVGTPDYMSPEQAALGSEDVDTRTDVYSLGVILYRILVGALPFDPEELRRAGLEGMMRFLREREAPRPSSRVSALGEESRVTAAARGTVPSHLESELRGDLDWILMKTLEKERGRRYGSPLDLARDLDRHLHDEPVVARPPSGTYRLSKFVRRHRLGVSIGAIGTILLVAFAATMAVQRNLVAKERDRAEREAAKASAVNEFLQSMLASADPWAGGDRDVTVREMLDAAAERTHETFGDDPLAESEVRTTIGTTYSGLGRTTEAEAMMLSALELARSAVGPDGAEVARVHETLASIYRQEGRYPESIESAREALRVQRLLHEPPHAELVTRLHDLALVLAFNGEYEEAERVANDALAMNAALSGDRRFLKARILGVLSAIEQHARRDIAKADSLSTESLELVRAVDPLHPDITAGLNNLAVLKMQAGDLEAASAIYDTLLALQEKITGKDHPEYAAILENSGNVLFQQGNIVETLRRLEQVRELRERNLGEDNVLVARTLFNMGAVAFRMEGGTERSAEFYSEAVPRLAAALGTDHPDYGLAQRAFGQVLQRLGRLEESETRLRAAVKASEVALDPGHRNIERARSLLAVTLHARGKDREAELEAKTAYGFLMEELGKDHKWVRETARVLMEICEGSGREELAAEYRAVVEGARE